MTSDDKTKLLNDLDVKELYERQSDARSAETVGLSLTTLLCSLVALALANNELAGTGGLNVAWVLIIVGGVALWMDRVLRIRLRWLNDRCLAAAGRLRDRNGLPEAYDRLGEHQSFDESGVVGALQSHRLRARLRFTSVLSPVALLQPLGSTTLPLGVLLVIFKVLTGI